MRGETGKPWEPEGAELQGRRLLSVRYWNQAPDTGCPWGQRNQDQGFYQGVQPNILLKMSRPASWTGWNQLSGLDSMIWIAMMGDPLETLTHWVWWSQEGEKRLSPIECGGVKRKGQGGHWNTRKSQPNAWILWIFFCCFNCLGKQY